MVHSWRAKFLFCSTEWKNGARAFGAEIMGSWSDEKLRGLSHFHCFPDDVAFDKIYVLEN